MSLEALASKAGLTKGFLSEVERGRKDPSISTVVELARAMDVPISKIFENPDEAHAYYSLVRSSERKPIARQGTLHGYEYEAIAYRKQVKKMEPFIASLPTAPPREYFRHEGEEMIFILEGRIGLYLQDEYLELGKGDCIYFDASIPHRSFSLGKRRSKALIVVTPE